MFSKVVQLLCTTCGTPMDTQCSESCAVTVVTVDTSPSGTHKLLQCGPGVGCAEVSRRQIPALHRGPERHGDIRNHLDRLGNMRNESNEWREIWGW